MAAEVHYRLIKKSIVEVPMNGKVYRETKILEEVVRVTAVIDLTMEPSDESSVRPSNSNTPGISSPIPTPLCSACGSSHYYY